MSKQKDCIEWAGRVGNSGYGQRTIYVDSKRATITAHRKAYIDAHGPIPDGMYVLHSCDNKICINPEHLRLGTPQDNMNDKVSRNRQSRMVGELSGSAKLCNGDIPRIRDMIACGVRAVDIARWFDVRPVVITKVKTGRTWQCIQGV